MTECLEVTAHALCIFGLLYGAYFAVAYGRQPQAVRNTRERFDPLTSHSWNVVGKGR